MRGGGQGGGGGLTTIHAVYGVSEEDDSVVKLSWDENAVVKKVDVSDYKYVLFCNDDVVPQTYNSDNVCAKYTTGSPYLYQDSFVAFVVKTHTDIDNNYGFIISFQYISNGIPYITAVWFYVGGGGK